MTQVWGGPLDAQQPLDGGTWDQAVQAAEILIVEEQNIPNMLPSYPDKIYVAVQANAAAALRTCSQSVACGPFHPFPLLLESTATFPVTGPCRRTSFRLAMCARVQERLHVAQEGAVRARSDI